MNPRTVGIYIYDEVEVLDFAGPFEVFSTAARVYARQHPDSENIFNLYLIADRQRTVPARGGFRVQPHFDITNHPRLDILLIPGGVVSSEIKRAEIVEWISESARQAELTASVCTGAFLLARAGLLNNQTVTTHWEDQEDLQKMFPDLQVIGEKRWVDNGKTITSAGISAGIDMSLHIVERLIDERLANQTAHQMEFDRHL